MATVVFRNVRIFDGFSPELSDACDVVVAEGLVQEIVSAPVALRHDAQVLECAGRVLMPGLIDAHVHVYACGVDLLHSARAPATYLAHYAARFLRASLERGFTSLRDVGGGDVGLAAALRDGLLAGPRLFYGGRMISQTGGHGDFRPGDHDLDCNDLCGCAPRASALAVIADGAEAVRLAVREELRRGASHVKIMASGGVASPTDPLDRSQYSDAEIRAAVDEAGRAGKYVAAHCHPAHSIARCVTLGVRSIEHGTLIDEATARLVAQNGAYVVPTMATIFALLADGAGMGISAASMAKLRIVADRALDSLGVMRDAGVKMGFGTDLLGALHTRQGTEFDLRARVLPALDILRSACAINAELLGEGGRLGCVRPGARADLLIVDGDPLIDVGVLAGDGRRLPVIMKAGRLVKHSL